MPLSSSARRMLNNFREEYGKKKGKQVFYAYKNKHKQKA